MDQFSAFQAALKAHTDPERTAFDAKYHKSDRVH